MRRATGLPAADWSRRARHCAGLTGRPPHRLPAHHPSCPPRSQRRRLDPDNSRDEQRLLSQLFRLLRAGRLSAARALCKAVGQPWRAASLGGGGGQGPVPLGAAADEADALDPLVDQAEDLAAEQDAGPHVLRALWRWSCYQVSERAAGAAAEAGGGAAAEAALYGALASNVTRVLPACASWEDAAWAYLRCWLDAAVDLALAQGGGAGAATGGAASGDVSHEAPPPADALLGLGADADEAATVAEGLAAAQGSWPVPRVRDSLPPSFRDALAAAAASRPGGGAASAAGAGSPAVGRFRKVQASLILDQIHDLVCETLVQWISQSSGVATGSAGDVSSATPAGAAEVACPPGLMRFGAHLALALWALDIAAVSESAG